MLTAASIAGVQFPDGSDTVTTVIWLAIGLVVALFWIAAAVSIVRNRRLTGGGKFLWFVVIIAFPFLGCLGWFLFGRRAQLVRPGVAPPAHA